MGIVIADIRNPFYPRLVRAIDDAAKARGGTSILAQVDFDRSGLVEEVERLLLGLVDGIIFASSWGSSSSLSRLREQSLPFVFVTCIPDDPLADYAVGDDRLGAMLAIDHLADLGHRRIAHIASDEPDSSSADRIEGYRSALRARGLSVHDRLILIPKRPGNETPRTPGDGYDAAMQLMNEPEPPTAIFCGNDQVALRAMEAIEVIGLRIPEDVSIVGYDDVSVASIPRIGLTTVAQPVEEMGRVVADWILSGAADAKHRGPFQAVFRPWLVVRRSTGPVSGWEPNVP